MPNRRKFRLGKAERKRILSAIGEISDRFEVEGTCLYGSRVTGYANTDSDYDLVIAIRKYNSKVRYRYITGEIEISAILVNSSSLRSDASKASLGEFVVGRFLNPYEPITGSELFSEVELVYKRRVVQETLDELITEYGDFAEDLLIPVRYFLFEKLRKRAGLYPPASYSYGKTYGGEIGNENLKRTSLGFLEVIKELESLPGKGRRIMLHNNEIVRIVGARKRRQFGRIKTAFSGTQRGLRQYAVHGYAGRVGPSIVRKELLSKISRVRDNAGELPSELKDPKGLLVVEEGKLLLEGLDWLAQLKEELKLAEDSTVTTMKLGGSSTKHSVFTGNSKPRNFVSKRFRSTTSVRQLFSNLRIIPSKSRDVSPLARLHREYTLRRIIRSRDIPTEKIVAIVLPEKIIVRDYIEGTSLSSVIGHASDRSSISPAMRIYGSLLSRIHLRGFSLGDSTPNNIISSGRQLHVLNWEHAMQGGDISWDISEFLYSSLTINPNPDFARHIISSFFDGYFMNGTRESLAQVMKARKYFLPFKYAKSSSISRIIREELTRSLSEIS